MGFAWACPFCSVTSQTLSEEMEGSDVAVLAQLVQGALPPDPRPDGLGGFGTADPDTGDATFKILEILRGEEHLLGTDQIEVIYFGDFEEDKVFFVTGLGTDPIDWTTPLALSEVGVDYLRQLTSLAKEGADRLAFFQEYFEHDDPLLAKDAYDEFARAPYADVQALSDRMHHDQLVAWVQSAEVSPTRRRLYLTMLGTCGGKEDLPFLEEMILSDYRVKKPIVEGMIEVGLAMAGPLGLPMVSEMVKVDERRKKLGLDAMIACYLTLGGPAGLEAIDERFLQNPDAEYTYVYSTIMALRFHGEETDVLPHERLLASMRLLLDKEDFADQVVLDLARWEDWSILDRLVTMFQESEEHGFIRQPVITYLTVASEQEGEVGSRAAMAIKTLEQFDPKTVKQARSLMAFGTLARARPKNEDNSNATRAKAQAEEEVVEEKKEEPEAADAETDDVDTDGVDIDAAVEEKIEPLTPPSRGWILGVPLLAGAFLVGLFWWILRA